MKIYYDINEIDFDINRAITIGGFDGIHLGHQQILKTLFIKAEEQNLKKLVITFDPLPKHFFSNKNNQQVLTLTKEKIAILEQFGIDELLIIEFNSEISKLSAYSFVEMLVDKIGFKTYVVGENHTFGQYKEGNLSLLYKLSNKFNNHFEVSGVKSIEHENKIISSSLIKDFIVNENIEKVNLLLGYNYFIIGEVIKGNKIGRELGFPTANIKISTNKIIVKNGVYLVDVDLWGKKYYGLANVGTKPTVTGNNYSDNVQTEVYILDFENDIYGVELNVKFLQFIRAEQKFKDRNELTNQIKNDVFLCKSIINNLLNL